MLYRKIDDNGLFLEDVILDSVPTLEDGSPDPHYVETPCPSGFYQPKWDGEKWVEGGVAPETIQPEPTMEERILALEQLELARILGGI